ncbi:hypothetical protein [Spiractinospora alimapuensis]|uniref:hypothetical protein n=1 Tax=Spiractinospora alimapuensis TaxID=2820884 RepID=UPI001F30DCE8|nr:hypothetical protein [Spiractinospora alimapuensis]
MRTTWGMWGAVAMGVSAAMVAGTAGAGHHPAYAQEWRVLDLDTAERVNAELDANGLRAESADLLGAALDEESARASALATFPATELDSVSSTVEVDVDTSASPARPRDLLGEVRGRDTSAGIETWSEWRELDDVGAGPSTVDLPTPSREIQVRVSLGPDSERDDESVTAVRVRVPDDAEAPETDSPGGNGERRETGGEQEPTPEAGDDPAFSARLFATRIGLVGNQTANGHTIRKDDYFVALPSRRGLAQRGDGDYTVRVCTIDEPRRCAYLPVWDVGPWNITDDHWNEARESWTDLPQGRPQAEAAYQDGHNDGLDGFGRRVANPAGIDLADGAFDTGLALPTNAWVDVDYLWTAQEGVPARVATESERDPVVLRGGPGTDYPDVGRAAHAAHVQIECQSDGREVSGPQGPSDAWYRLGAADFIPATFVQTEGDVPVCGE